MLLLQIHLSEPRFRPALAIAQSRLTASIFSTAKQAIPRYRSEQPRKIRRVADFFGDREVLSLSESDVHRYSEARLTGKSGTGKAVRLGTVWSELTALKIACAWATRHRVNGNRKLLTENPLAGISIPQESTTGEAFRSHHPARGMSTSPFGAPKITGRSHAGTFSMLGEGHLHDQSASWRA